MAEGLGAGVVLQSFLLVQNLHKMSRKKENTKSAIRHWRDVYAAL